MRVKINPEKPDMDVESALDLMGASFKADHTRGLAEWWKNAYDQHVRDDVPEGEQHIVQRFSRRGRVWTFETVDFCGTTCDQVRQYLMVWCKRDAAGRGISDADVLGGHGNGGKFYMRQGFRTSEFITYRNGRLTVFAFDEQKRYGFDSVYEDKPVPPQEALDIAGINPAWLPDAVRTRFQAGDVRFTLVRGIDPIDVQRFRVDASVDRLKRHPQSRQVVQRCRVSVVVNDRVHIERLTPEPIPPKPGFEEPLVVRIPRVLQYRGAPIEFPGHDTSMGELTLRTAAEPFKYRGEQAELHVIDFVGRTAIIGTHRIGEFPTRNRMGAEFIYGECACPALEHPDVGAKQNDRSRLNNNDYTHALFDWIAEQIDGLAAKLVEEKQRRQSERDAAITSAFSKLLNQFKNRFLQKFSIELQVGKGDSGAGGSSGDGGGAGGGGGGKSGKDSNQEEDREDREGQNGNEGAGGGEGGEKTTRGSRFPVILISGVDKDPDSGETLVLSPAHPIKYQRIIEDVPRNIWWVNAQRTVPARIIEEEGAESARWRDYLFQVFTDVIVTYTLHARWKEHSGDPSPDDVNQWNDDMRAQVQEEAALALADFLFPTRMPLIGAGEVLSRNGGNGDGTAAQPLE